MDKYLQWILIAGSLATSIGIAVANFMRGNRGESGEIIEFYKKQASEYKIILESTRKEYTEKHEGLIKEVGTIRGELNTERQLRQQYEAILKDKNPETTAFMQLMVQSTKDQAESHKAIVKGLTAISEVMNDIHTMAKAEHERDFKVTATVQKQ